MASAMSPSAKATCTRRSRGSNAAWSCCMLRGQRERARTALSTVINLYRAMEMTFWLPEAEAGLAQVEGG